MTSDFMISVIARDFNVDHIASNKNAHFFASLKKQVWHFVHAIVNDSETGFHTNFKQWHIPRYVMANRMEYMRLVENQDPSMYFDFLPDLHISITASRKITFSLRAITDGVNDDFKKSLEQDIPSLEISRTVTKEKNGIYTLPRSKTVNGNSISDESLELIQAIAFERLSQKKLDASQFGIYSAFCTQNDFSNEERHPRSEIERLMDEQFSYQPEDLPEDVLQAVMDAQIEFMGKHIWGPDVALSKNQAVDEFTEHLKKLKPRYSAQFSLMIGMHQASIFLPIAVIFEIITYRQYLDWMTAKLQPDSDAEQYMLGTTAFIELFGSL